MEREIYERLSTKLDYETFIKCYCPECEKENCIHRGAYRRLPAKAGGLGLCPNLQINKN
ncbi:MAG: hypothetical protein KHZ13_13190 [Firmicutes bacterium]|nr:hypothetical protein [Bacillota bacterium]